MSFPLRTVFKSTIDVHSIFVRCLQNGKRNTKKSDDRMNEGGHIDTQTYTQTNRETMAKVEMFETKKERLLNTETKKFHAGVLLLTYCQDFYGRGFNCCPIK